MFRFRAPMRMSIKNPIIFCASLESPSGHTVVLEAWRNGVYGGEVPLNSGANDFKQTMQLQPMDLIELKVCIRGTGDAETFVRDLWVLFST